MLFAYQMSNINAHWFYIASSQKYTCFESDHAIQKLSQRSIYYTVGFIETSVAAAQSHKIYLGRLSVNGEKHCVG